MKSYKPNGETEFRPAYLIQQQKQWKIITLISKILFKKFYTGMMNELIKNLAGLLN